MRKETSSTSAARFLRLYAERNGEEPHLRPPRATSIARWVRADVDLFREIVLEHVGWFPRAASEIQHEVTHDYGPHIDRRFWRALRYHMITRRIERVEDGYRLVRKRRAGRRT